MKQYLGLFLDITQTESYLGDVPGFTVVKRNPLSAELIKYKRDKIRSEI